jgi:hypothetical protein
VNLPFENSEQRLLWAVTQFYLRGYKQDESGDITEVTVEIGSKKRNLTYDDFRKLFEFDYLNYVD